MGSEMATKAGGRLSDLDWLLSGLVQRVPYTRSAVLLTADGLVTCVHGMDADSADHMAALACGLYSLGRSAGGGGAGRAPGGRGGGGNAAA
ncbi:roadblock/LC7 domain-containing protein, partial [Streptomyces sp. NPDC059742]|uniref:roadblock/LC7 domain-containing protein n=1 Tax=Streptomyces sp. NPDC059742 TaxID=3346927 RepID=UPI0036585DEA